MSRRMMLAGNWKMNKTISEAINLAVRLKYSCNSVNDRDIVLCPPYTSLKPVAETVKDSSIEVGAQNMHHQLSGPYTGEVSPEMITDAGADWVIIGHSERRQHFSEDNQLLHEKLATAAREEIKVIFCVGETEQQRDEGKVAEVLTSQLKETLSGLDHPDFVELVIAYEPVWAIGTGNTATPEQANQAHQLLRQVLADIFTAEIAGQIRILYGGSVKPHNAAQLLGQSDIDGALVGGASLAADDFTAIVKFDTEENISIVDF